MKRKIALPLVIGQAPGRPTVNGYLSPLEGPSGERLAKLAGMEWRHFVCRVDRMNLLQEWPGKSGRGDAFPRALGTIAAEELMASGKLNGRAIVLLGKEVARCFGLSMMPYLASHMIWRINAEVLLMPHPSGVCRFWNDQANTEKASEALKLFLSTH